MRTECEMIIFFPRKNVRDLNEISLNIPSSYIS